MGTLGLIRLVLACELRRLLRDGRAILFAVVLPVVAFPLLFLSTDGLGEIGRDALAARDVRLVHDLAALPPDDGAALLSALDDPELLIEAEARAFDAADEELREQARTLFADGFHALLLARPPTKPAGPARLEVYFDEASETSREAARRVRGELLELLSAARDERLVALVGEDPGARFEPLPVDVARPEDTAGRSLGGLLPLLAVLVLISGGSFAALDAFAGEREAGTLETLLVQPAPALALAWGKFLAVALTGTLAFAGNALSLFLCLVFEFGSLPALPEDVAWSATAGRLLLACAVFLPTAALVSAVLSLVAARARTFRQGQLLTMPLSFAALALAAPSVQPTTELGVALALVPITGGALAMRDAAAGAPALLPQLICLLASTGWAAFALSRLRRTVDAERLLSTSDVSDEANARRVHSSRAIRFGAVSALLVYVVGGRMQAAAPVAGLLATLYGLVVFLAVLAAARSARRTGEPLGTALGLVRAAPSHLVGAALLAPAAGQLVQRVFALQQRLLPMPSTVGAEALVSFTAELSLPLLVLLLAVSPGICEELLFRGALLRPMRRDLAPAAVVLWQALLFGAVHASIYRFVPTALVGALLAVVALRARSVFPAIVLHVGYNGLLVTASLGEVAWLGSPWLALLALPGAWLLARPSAGDAQAGGA
ncbi:MAG: CPBP family glutamic-type intramembrane protease [Planctomycetota bacterium]